MVAIEKLIFRYRGDFDYHRFYREARQFFLDRQYEFMEVNYKDKGDEYESKWKAMQKIDLYNEISYVIDFKAENMKPVTVDGKPMYNGKIMIYISIELSEEGYSVDTFEGKKTIFGETKGDKWLHKLYKRVTERDREEEIGGTAIILGHQLLAKIKEIIGTETT